MRDPEQVVGAGLADSFGLETVTLTDISFAFRQFTYDMWQVVRDYLDDLDRASLTTDEQLSYDIYSWQTDTTLAQRDFLHFEFQGSYLITSETSQDQTFFTELQPLTTEQDARDYLTRLALVDDKFEQLRDNLETAETRGVIQPAYTLGVSAGFHRSTGSTSASAHTYYVRFSDSLDSIPELSASLRSEFREEAQRIITNEVNPAYLALADFLDNQLTRAPGEVGVEQFPDGDEYYRRQLKYHTTTDLSAEAIHELGNEQVARVQAELRERFDALGYPQDETLAQLFERVENDSGFVDAEDVLPTYAALVEDAEIRMQSLFNRLPVTPVTVEGGEGCCFYIAASLDGSRPGTFFVDNSRPQPWYNMPSLAYHEAMPGHHMQIALEQELGLPGFRLMAQFTGYIEGWGLYAERLAHDYNWYEGDPYGDIGRLNFELLRATRLVVDTGIHHYGWSVDQAVAYLQENLGSSQSSAESNVGRYSLWPGQATAYMIGMLEILELREQVDAAQGDAFNIADFHSLILESGSMPLELLDQWVESAL